MSTSPLSHAALLHASRVLIVSLVMGASASAWSKVVFRFVSTNGRAPTAVILGSDGRLHGTTIAGGEHSNGTCYSMTKKGNDQRFGSFQSDESGDGPNESLVEMPDGYLYGTTNFGGKKGMGTVFRCPRSGGSPQGLASFNGKNGSWPLTGLMRHSSGDLYGTTSQ